MAANAPPVQKPNDNSDHRSNPVATTAAAQRQPNIPNAYALNTDFTFVDRPEKKVHWTKRNCFFRWICCSMCFPPWVAYILRFIVIALIICIIVIGALLGSFKMPTIDFAGLNSTLPNGTQQIEFSSTGVVIHAGLILNVMNPNVLSMKLSDLTAKVNKKTCCIFQPLVHSHKLLLGILPYQWHHGSNWKGLFGLSIHPSKERHQLYLSLPD